MATALFISPSQIKQQTFIDENVDEKQLINAIVYCQEEYTKNMLGTALYNEIKGQIEAGTITANNTTLRDDYIRHALKWWVVYEVMGHIWMKETNKSVMLKNSDNSNPVDLNAVLNLKSDYRNKAERFDDKLKRYLVENQATFPLYYQPGTGVDTVHPKNNTYNVGWYLGGTDNTYGLPIDYGDCCE